jgi:hypothetical protein
MTAESAQLGPLIRLRWRMVRSRGARWGFGVLAAVVPGLGLAAVAVGLVAPDLRAFDVTLLAPTAYLSVALLAVVSPLVAGGGNELFPDDQLVAYPITARTQYVTSLALAPLNLAWTAQLVGLLGITAYISPRPELVALPLIVCLAYVALVTTAGQALAWLVVGWRQREAGRRWSWALGGALVVTAAVVVAAGAVPVVLDRAPTTYVVIGALDGGTGDWGWWSITTALLLLLTAAAWFGGRRACAWALRQPGGLTQSLNARPVVRRPARRGIRRALLAADRASVWRSAPLRRGLVVLGVLPGIVAVAAGLDWVSLTLLPGLVAAGAGLLFGVNVFCLDASGSLWLASQPHDQAAAIWSKAQVIVEVCLAAVLITLVAGTARMGSLPSGGELAALLVCSVVVTGRVLAICLDLSVRRPHRADLRGPRDAPAPPGVMAAYSARLALSTTLVGVLFSGLAELAAWQWSVALGVPFLLLSLRRVLRSARLWQDVEVRARIVSTVSSG